MNSESVGIIGMGIIGARVARRLRAAHRQVYVWSRSPKAVPNFLGSAREVAAQAAVVQLFVTGGPAALEVVDAMLDELTPEHTIINSATIAPEETLEIADRVGRTGAGFVDAPFTGSKDAAEAGTLVYFAGGDPAVIARAAPVLELSSRAIVSIGDVGDGTAVKIATNMIAAATVGGLAEALGLCIAMDVPPERLARALEHHGVSSALLQMKLPQMAEARFDPHFSLANMVKDADIALSLASSFGIDLPVIETVARSMRDQMDEGNADRDFSIVASRYFKGDARVKGGVSASVNVSASPGADAKSDDRG